MPGIEPGLLRYARQASDSQCSLSGGPLIDYQWLYLYSFLHSILNSYSFILVWEKIIRISIFAMAHAQR